MTRRNEFLVGLSLLGATGAVVGGALWLSEADVGRTTRVQTARFRSIGRLQPGAPVLYRGVRVGNVAVLRLAADNWVEADLRLDRRTTYPDRPAVIALSSSLFGEWQAEIVSRDQLTDNPIAAARIDEASASAGARWPGTDLPGIGELTLQANRIANDVQLITSRVEGAIDSGAIAEIRAAVGDLRVMADRLQHFAHTETSILSRITSRFDTVGANLATASGGISATASRLDTATSSHELEDIIGNARSTSANLRDASADIRDLTTALRANRETLVRILQGIDTVMARIQRGDGTLAKLSADSALYVETTGAIVELRTLIAEIRANPRKFFHFSVF